MIGLTPEAEIALLSYHKLKPVFTGKVIHLIVVGIIDQAVFTINEDPVEASAVNDALGKWGRGVSEHERAGRVTDEQELT